MTSRGGLFAATKPDHVVACLGQWDYLLPLSVIVARPMVTVVTPR